MSDQIQAVEVRLAALENAIERITRAIERLASNSERIVALETKADLRNEENNRRISALERDNRDLHKTVNEIKGVMIRIGVIASAATGMTGIVVSIVARQLFGV